MTQRTFGQRAVARAGALLVMAGAPLGAQTGASPASPAPAVVAPTVPVPDSGRALSLDDALRIAEATSENVRVARAGVERARGNEWRARSQFLPQLYGSLQYTKTLKSQFEVLRNSAAPDTRPPCMAFDTAGFGALTESERVARLAAGLALTSNCAPSSSGGIDFSKVGFGAKNQYQLGLQVSQNLFAGGRIVSQLNAAQAGRRAAETELRAQRAQAILDVTQAYYDAALADRLATISDSALSQTEAVLRQTTLARQVGNTSEFELLRARVTRDNQVPVAIQRHAQRDLALQRLRQLLEIPQSVPMRLTTDLVDTAQAPAARLASFSGLDTTPDTSTESRAAVRQAGENVRAQQAALRVARAERLPAITLSSQYGRVAYPMSGVPNWNDFVQNWTVSVGLQVPLFTGGRLHGDALVAKANLDEARAQRQQIREYAALDAASAITALREAEAAFASSAGTSEQATRAYSIAALRYREGISTQTELSESRLLLQQAEANRANAARNLQVARVRLALLKDLPLQATGAAGGAGGAGGGFQQQNGTTQQGGAQPAAPQQQQGQQGQSAALQTGQTGGFAP